MQAIGVFPHPGATYWRLRLPAAPATRDLPLPRRQKRTILALYHRESEACRLRYASSFANAASLTSPAEAGPASTV